VAPVTQALDVQFTQFFDAPPSPSRRPSKADLRKAKRTIKTERQIARTPPPFVPKSEAQKEYLEAIRDNDVVLASGGAGVGKTYVAARYALAELLAGNIERVIVTRPMVPVSGEAIGFLPGDVKEKCFPWAIPIIDAFNEGASKMTVEKLLKDGRIDFVPFALMRGRTFANCVILADESQNLTVEQAKVLITRVGEDSKIIISGDVSGHQSDIRGVNGLDFLIRIADQYDLDCEVFEFDDDDVVRSGVAAAWVKAFTEHGDRK
jgi:phosphate starvation-inducible PhoH-like protein